MKYSVLGGVEAMHMPGFDFSTARFYGYDGEILEQVQTNARKPVLPILVKGSTSTEFLTNLRFLLHPMSPLRGDGMLKVYTVDGKTRVLRCRMLESPIVEGRETGLFTASAVTTGPIQWRKFPATFFAPYPYWYDPIETEKTWIGSATDLSYPQDVYNSGNVDTWPQITVDPNGATSFQITNETTGKYLYFNAQIGSIHYLYVDCRPGYRGCCVDHRLGTHDGPPITYGNVYHHLSATSSIDFELQPGENRISFVFTAGSGAEIVRMKWMDRYNGV